jgi:2,4-dienoyl-CoA reductase-like NADH-dependent reductase (Old Yellow Enzyme family)
MCQYSVTDGFVGDYHLVHLGRFALGGFGLVIARVTAEGPISPGDVGLWSDEHVPGLARVADFLPRLAGRGRLLDSLGPWTGPDPVQVRRPA